MDRLPHQCHIITLSPPKAERSEAVYDCEGINGERSED